MKTKNNYLIFIFSLLFGMSSAYADTVTLPDFLVGKWQAANKSQVIKFEINTDLSIHFDQSLDTRYGYCFFRHSGLVSEVVQSGLVSEVVQSSENILKNPTHAIRYSLERITLLEALEDNQEGCAVLEDQYNASIRQATDNGSTYNYSLVVEYIRDDTLLYFSPFSASGLVVFIKE